jgi:phage shock protein PspC (stress-responsive transcriptional regulator)
MGETAGGVLRRGRDRLIGGVCSGLAASWHLDPLLVRIAAVVLLFVPPIGPFAFLVYLILWLSMPPPDGWPGGVGPPLNERWRLISREAREDFRWGFGHAQAPPPTDAPPPGEGQPVPPGTPPSSGRFSGGRLSGWAGGPNRHTGGLWFGGLLIILGLYLLGENLGILSAFRWDIFWPVIIIALGLLILLRRGR